MAVWYGVVRYMVVRCVAVRYVAVLCVAALGLVGCSSPGGVGGSADGSAGGGLGGAPPVVVGVSAPHWQSVALPAGPGRPEVRDVTACPGNWYAVGGYLAGDGSVRPAAWHSPDGRNWLTMTMHPVSAYGPSHLLSAVACRGGEVAAVGAAAGGVHGNPRTGTWFGDAGELSEVPAAFELYGGPNAIGVGRIAAGPAGWVIEGARDDANGRAGVAVWASPDGHTFRLIDADPALESDGRGETTAADVTVAPDGRFLVLGSALPTGGAGARAPLLWSSTDGLRWVRQDLPAAAEDEDLERITPYRGGMLAAGIRGNGFGTFIDAGNPSPIDSPNPAGNRNPAGAWRRAGRFGTFGGTGLPRVTGLVGGTGDPAPVFATGTDGGRYRLWGSPDGTNWRELSLPGTPIAAGSQHIALLFGLGGRLLLATDDGTATRLWYA